MANGLLDILGGAFGTTPPMYMEGLLGADAMENLRKRSIGSGLVNALIGYAAMPKNQNLGLGRILAGTAQAGIHGAQNVYGQALDDFQTQQKIEDMNIQRALQMQKLKEQQQLRQLAPQLIREVPAVTEYEDQGTYFMPQPAAAGAEAPNYNMQPVTREPIERVVTPARREIDMNVLQKILGVSSDPLGVLKTSAELVPALRRAGMMQTGDMDNPFLTWVETAQSPQVQKLARQYARSFENGTIDLETADKRISDLARADEAYQLRTETKEDRAARDARDFELRKQLADNTISQSEFNRQMASNSQAMHQSEIDYRKEQAARKQPLPAGALKLESEDITSAYDAVTLAEKIDAQINSLLANKVDFSPAKNARLATMSAIGSNDPEVLAYNDFHRFKTTLVNESLRLNKGTQTEGDAIRAANELSNARSTQDVIKSLEKIRDINARAVENKNKIIASRRRSGGLTEDLGYAAPEQVPVPQFPKVFFKETDPAFKSLPKGTVFIDGNTGQRKVK